MNKIKTPLIIITAFLTLSSFSNVYADNVDTNPPVITLNGSENVKVTQNYAYVDAGATAIDDIDGDITANILIVNGVNTNQLGLYTITYNVSDQALNNATEVTRVVEVVAPVLKESILIRNGETLVWQGDFDLPSASTIEVLDKLGNTHTIDARSVLGILYSLDQSSDAFEISDLEYYSSFNAFYLKCITPKNEAEICDNWQYVVGGVTPSTGMDTTMLSGGESLGLYFGSPHQVIFDKTTITAGSSFVATAQKYKYTDNTWDTLTGVTIGVTLPDPNDPWNPVTVKEQSVDTEGKATITLSDLNTYTVGIKEDYYFPSYTVKVITASGGGGGSASSSTLDVGKAVNFLLGKQSSNGSFGASLYTDWVAIGLASSSNSILNSYLLNNQLNSSLLTDNERHAMALMALGINPYSGTDVNYIAKIISSFDGNQFGDSSITNDDIFALIVLKNAGYTSSDEIIKKTASYIISKQSSDGSWVGVDITAAAILALRNFIDLPGASSSIAQAENYLLSAQSGDGGFGNSSSTSWALQALSQNPSFAVQVANADNYLASIQQADGGVDAVTDPNDNRIWATSYAISGALHKSWNSIMQSFSKQVTSPIVVDNSTVPLVPVITKVEEIKKVEQDEVVTPIIKKVKNKKTTQIKKLAVALPSPYNDIPLTASAVDPSSNHGISYRVLHTIIKALSAPFVWLFVHLGF